LKTLVFTRSPEFAKLATDEAGRTFDPITPAQVDENFKAETNRLTDIAPLAGDCRWLRPFEGQRPLM